MTIREIVATINNKLVPRKLALRKQALRWPTIFSFTCANCKKLSFTIISIRNFCSRKCMGRGQSRRQSSKIKCYFCSKEFYRKNSLIGKWKCNFCSNKCRHKGLIGEYRYNWKGGIRQDGYRTVWIKNRGNMMEHRLIMEKHINRVLRKNEIVHHKDHNRSNNDISNLKIFNQSEHMKLHYNEGNHIKMRNDRRSFLRLKNAFH